MMPKAHAWQQAIAVYLQQAYPSGAVPQAVRDRAAPFLQAPPEAEIALEWLEPATQGNRCCYALRLGQPMYPHMKLIAEETPEKDAFLFRADAHDTMLHAPPGSPDAAPLAALRAMNQALVEKIEAAWAAAGVPTFRQYLREQLAKRREAKGC